jgi:hypothetical protein
MASHKRNSSNAELSPHQIAQQEQQTAKERYVHRVLVALDQFANVILGGDPDETISARSARAAERGNWLGKFMCWWLDKIQSSHGQKAECGDLERAKIVEQIESRELDRDCQAK